MSTEEAEQSANLAFNPPEKSAQGYQEVKPRDPLGPKKKIGRQWVCPCGSPNNPMASVCANCKSPKGAHVGIDFIGNTPLGKGETHENKKNKHVTGPTPPGHMMLQASIPDVKDKDLEDQSEIDDALVHDEEGDFKQLLTAPVGHDPLEKLKKQINRHDNAKRSFEALFGGPESDYAGGVL